jgi:hypothetical protein
LNEFPSTHIIRKIYVFLIKFLSTLLMLLKKYIFFHIFQGRTNESGNAMVLKCDLLIYSKVIRAIIHLYDYNEKVVGSSLFLK